MLYDTDDQLLRTYGLGTMQQQLSALAAQLGPEGLELFVDGAVVNYIVGTVQRAIENQWQMTRLDTKRYDEVVEDYRHNLYTLRRLILGGNVQQRRQVLNFAF